MPPSDEELKELEELKAMIHGTPERASNIPMGAVNRYLVNEHNRSRADVARQEKEERDALKAELDAKRKGWTQKIKQEAAERVANEKAVREAARNRKLNVGRETREKEAAWKAEAEQRRSREWAIAQKRVQDENEQWKRMNANEAAQDKLERDEGTRDRKAVEAAFKLEKEQTLAKKRAQVAAIKKSTDPAVVEEALSWAAQKREAAAEKRRKDKQDLLDARRAVKEGHMNMAKDVRGHVMAVRENARAISSQILAKKKEEARKERDNDYLVQQEKMRMLANKKQQHQSIYSKKFATAEVAQSYAGASTLRRGGPATFGLTSPGS